MTYNDPTHREPHGASSTKPISHEKVDNAACETTKVVDRNDDAGQAVVRILAKDQWWLHVTRRILTAHGLSEGVVSNNTREYTLVVTEQYECELACKHNGNPRMQASLEHLDIHRV